MADRLGRLEERVEVVDFVLHSSDQALRSSDGRRPSNKDVQILGPFAGTGIFFVRLLQSDLIAPADLVRKYETESNRSPNQPGADQLTRLSAVTPNPTGCQLLNAANYTADSR
ncbi:hypothetical protein [Streptomyces sp. NPDC056244]|uniref:hypothetical protein n=1 Tax=Streptomyces sp. NPDC056244 TaxID=3345762 RepID=UPI0035DBA2D4